jgi:hypothetical protein
MPIDKKLDDLIASAGRAQTREREAREDWRRAERDHEKRARQMEARARREAVEPARAIFAWIDGDTGRRLRAAMRAAGVESVALGPKWDNVGAKRVDTR